MTGYHFIYNYTGTSERLSGLAACGHGLQDLVEF